MSRRKRIRFGALLGLPIKVHPDDRTWSVYDGKMVHVSTANALIDIDHEMGHFLASTVHERKKPEWDLGRGVEYPDGDILKKISMPDLVDRRSHETLDEEKRIALREAEASVFGIAVTFTIGKRDEWRDHAALHTWDRANNACDVFCLIKDTEHCDLKDRLAKVLARLSLLKGTL